MAEIIIPLILVGLVLVLIIMLIKMAAEAARRFAGLVRRLRTSKTGPEWPIGRSAYPSSGNVRWTRFLPSAAATLGISALGALTLHGAYFMGVYYMLLLPVFAGVPVMAMVCWAVSAGHCRNRRIGWLLGLTAALVLYPGYYYVGWVHAAGIDNAHRIDELPEYIVWRMQTTVWVDGDERPGAHGHDQPPFPFPNGRGTPMYKAQTA